MRLARFGGISSRDLISGLVSLEVAALQRAFLDALRAQEEPTLLDIRLAAVECGSLPQGNGNGNG